MSDLYKRYSKRRFLTGGLLSAPLCLSSAASATAVFELGGTFYVVPTGPTDPIDPNLITLGKYCTIAKMTGEHAFGEVELDRPFMIDVESNGSVSITGPENSVPGTLSGSTISSNFPVSADTSAASCSGTRSLTGTGTDDGKIDGSASGPLPCTGLINSLAVSGSYLASKTNNASCPGL